MSNRYYVSSNELYHWKYIKREKVGDKWKYYYDNPDKYSETTRDTNKLFSKKYKLTDGKGNYHVYNRRGKIEQAIDDRKKDWSEAKQKVADAAKNSNGAIQDTDRWRSTKTTVEFGGGNKYEWRNRGRRERFVETAKEYVKDRLGFDEREALEKAQNEVSLSTMNKQTSLINAKWAYDALQKNKDNSSLKSYYEETVDDYLTKKDKYDEDINKRDKAKEIYYDTPIGKLAEAGEKIEAAADFVEDLFKRKTTVRFHSTTDVMKELEDFERMLNQRKKK